MGGEVMDARTQYEKAVEQLARSAVTADTVWHASALEGLASTTLLLHGTQLQLLTEQATVTRSHGR